MKIILFKDEKEEWRFRIVSRNGKIVAQSESYKKKSGALGGIRSIRTGILYAPIEESK